MGFAGSGRGGSNGAMMWCVRLAVGWALLVAAAGYAFADAVAPGDVRGQITAAELQSGTGMPALAIDNAWFMPVGEARPARHEFSGTLTIPETRMQGFDGDHELDGWFPEVELRFVNYDGHLIPVDADILAGTGDLSSWNLIVSPGLIWSEAADGGLSRASFPFVLAGGAWWNEAHNGLATFVFDDETVSDVQFQIVQETAPENSFAAFGRLAAVYTPQAIANARDVIADFKRDRASRLPVRPFAELEDGLSLVAFRTFAGTRTDEPVSASGVIVDDVLYLRPCETRYGDFPYCEDMRHGVFSVTKSMGALVSMLRLAEVRGDGVFDLKIKDYLAVAPDQDGWDDVTFADALNMATGFGDASLDPEGDSYWAEIYPGWKTTLFLDTGPASEKLRAALSGPVYPWGPGDVFRYRNMDTFVLSAAMDSLVKRLEGPDADLWDIMMEQVFRPIGIMDLPVARTQEVDGRRGIPMLAAGLYPNVHDIARIARLLQSGGRYGDQQLLSKAKLAEALYQTDIRGLDVAGHSGETYHMSFWYFPSRQSGCVAQVPRMDGWGGNLIELLPNGVTAFYLSDDFLYDYRELAEAADEIRPICAP
jgi:CubicO group peptidase (beta-lactamase class C family)